MKLVQFNILLRQWMRGGVSTAVSLVSLALGLICSTILLLFAVEEFRTADSLIPNPERKYMIMSEHYSQKGKFEYGVFKTKPGELAARFPQVIDFAVFKECPGVWQNIPQDQANRDTKLTIAATPSFTQYYKIPMIEGNLDSVLAAPDRIAITREYGALLFPDEDPMGKTMTVVFDDTVAKNYTVSAIVDNFKRSPLAFRAIYLLTPDQLIGASQNSQHLGVITLAPGADPQKICHELAKDTTYNSGKGWKMQLKPLNETYFVNDDMPADNWAEIVKTRSKSSLYIGLALAFVILFIAAFNYINITLTRSASRLKNLAGQRIMGATKWNVRGQIFADTAINVALAMVLALVFLPLSMERFNSFMSATISMSDLITQGNLLCVLALLIVLIVIPSVSLIIKFSIRNPLETFKNPERHRVRAAQSLVVAQIVVSVVLLTFGINVTRQTRHIANSMPCAEKIIEVQKVDDDRLPQAFIDAVRNSASTTKFISGRITPNNTYSGYDFIYQGTGTSPDFFDIMGLKLIEGRTFDKPLHDGIRNIVINQSMVKALDIKGTALGYIFRDNYRVVGVCPDLRLEDAKSVVLPCIYFYNKWSDERPWILYVRFTGSIEEKIAEMQKLYLKTAENGSLMPRMLTVANVYLTENPEITRMKTMIDVFTTISFLLTAFGLFGLSWYMVERRRREIAIRKTYGATVTRMVVMLCRSFLWQSLIAIVIALPAAYYISGYWLEGFVFRVNNAWWVLAISASLSLVVIFATVIGQTIRAALTNPVKYIKTE